MVSDFLKQPYDMLVSKWKLTVLPSIFVSLFMLVFQPFGISTEEFPYKIPILSGYGGATFLMLFFNFFVITKIFSHWFTNWTNLKQILWILWILFSIGVANFLYTAAVFSTRATLKLFWVFQVYTLLIGCLPVVGILLITRMIRLKKNLKKANELNNFLQSSHQAEVAEKEAVLTSTNEKDHFTIAVSNLLLIESVKNYIEIYYTENGTLKTHLLRSTIKSTESQLASFPSIIKSHRAYIVNISHVKNAAGNSNGLQLTINHIEKTIPVSQNNYAKIRDKLSHIL